MEHNWHRGDMVYCGYLDKVLRVLWATDHDEHDLLCVDDSGQSHEVLESDIYLLRPLPEMTVEWLEVAREYVSRLLTAIEIAEKRLAEESLSGQKE